jgi:hypothetical protein
MWISFLFAVGWFRNCFQYSFGSFFRPPHIVKNRSLNIFFSHLDPFYPLVGFVGPGRIDIVDRVSLRNPFGTTLVFLFHLFLFTVNFRGFAITRPLLPPPRPFSL